LTGYGVSGIPINGIATVPAGATLTATVNDGPSQTISDGGFLLAISSSGVGGTHGRALSVSPGASKAGKPVTIRARSLGVAPQAATLISKAFSPTYRFAGVPAVYANARPRAA
jgi:hypothetical protein